MRGLPALNGWEIGEYASKLDFLLKLLPKELISMVYSVVAMVTKAVVMGINYQGSCYGNQDSCYHGNQGSCLDQLLETKCFNCTLRLTWATWGGGGAIDFIMISLS